MATSHTQTKGAQTVQGTSVGVSLTGVVSGNHLVASTMDAGAVGSPATALIAPTSTPTATWSQAIGPVGDANGTSAGEMHYSENTASGSWTVSCKTNATADITGLVSESSGVATSSSLGAGHTSNSSTSSATLAPGSITPATGSILYTATIDQGSTDTADTIDSSFVISSPAVTWQASTGQRAGQAHLDNVAASPTNPTWSLPGGTAKTVVALMAEFVAAATVGYLPPPDPIYVHRRC